MNSSFLSTLPNAAVPIPNAFPCCGFARLSCNMAFKDGELSVAESPVAGSIEKNGLTAQDQIDMAEVGKKQQFNVSPFAATMKSFIAVLIYGVEKFWLHVNAWYAFAVGVCEAPTNMNDSDRLHNHYDVYLGGCFLVCFVPIMIETYNC